MELRRPVPRPGFLARAGLKPLGLPSALSERWRRLSFPLRIFLIVAGGLFLGFAAALSGFGGHVEAPGAVSSACTENASGVATVTLGSGSTTLTVNAAGALFFSQIPPSPGTPVPTTQCGNNTAVSKITFSVASGVSGNTLVFDETGNAFPCAATISGPVGTGSGAAVDILAPPAGDVTVGTTTLDLAGCGVTQGTVSKLTGVGSYVLVANGADTLSAAGEASPADPVTVPVTFQAAAASTVGVGGAITPGTETFDASNATGVTTTLDFRTAYPGNTCAATCSLVVNSSGDDLAGGPDDFTATISGGSTLLTTYDYSAAGSAVTSFDAITNGPTTFYGEAGSYTLTGLANTNPPSQVIAGAGTETYTVTGSGTTFSSGSDTDTFQVTGNNNDFVAGSGNDTFDDTLPTGVSKPVNTLDFSQVPSGSGGELAINDSGAQQTVSVGAANSTLTTGTAAVVPPPTQGSPPPYTFANGPGSSSSSNFTTIIGAGTGFTQFLAGGSGGLTLTGKGSANQALFYGSTGVVANLSGGLETTSKTTLIAPSTPLANNFGIPSGQVLVGAATANSTCALQPAVCDTLNGDAGSIQSVTGPPGGFSTFYAGGGSGGYTFTDQGGTNTFVGGAAADTFTGNGNNNDFIAGTGNGTFTDPGSGNTVDFSALSTAVTVNVSGQQVVSTPNNAASTTAGSPPATATYTFSSSPTTFIGSLGGTTFDAGGTADTFSGSPLSPTTTNQLNFASSTQATGGPLQVCVVARTGCTAGEALLGTVAEQFTNINQFNGLSQGNTTFVAGTPNNESFTATGTGNSIDFSAASSGVTVNMPGTLAGLAPGFGQAALTSALSQKDSFSGLTTVFGSTAGKNDFVAGSGSETFGDNGSSGGDAIDFSNVSTGAGSSLLVNVSGGPAGNNVPKFTALLGSSATYSFATGGSNFVTLTGSNNGNTTFFGGNTGGYTFNASSGNDSIDFTAATTALTVNLGSATSTSGTVAGFASGGPDTISGLTTVTAPPKNNNSFTAGSSPGATYDFIANSNGNRFVGGAGPDTFESSGSNNTVTAGTGDVTFKDTVGSGNTMDFGSLPAGDLVLVNVSGQSAQTPNDTATGTQATSISTYSFGTTVTTFKGAPAGTTFDAGGASDAFIGSGATNAVNVLNFDNLPSTVLGPLQVCVVAQSSLCSAGQALLGAVPDTFQNITTYEGLPSGNTTFFAGTPNNSTYEAFSPNNTPPNQAGNSIDFSAASSGVTVNMPGTLAGLAPGFGQAALTSALSQKDSFSDLTTVFGSTAGKNDFVAGSGSETFGDNGSSGGDAIDFSNVSTGAGSSLLVNVSGGPAGNNVPNFTAMLGSSATYSVATGGSNFVTLTGSNNGNTTFFGGNTGGYTFNASSGNDSIDFTAATTALTVNLGSATSTSGTVAGFASGGPDTISGLTTVTAPPKNNNSFTAGSSPGATYDFIANSNGNRFVGGAGPDTFESSGSNNTVTAGTGDVTFKDTVGSGNTMDFGSLPAGDLVLVNVSGQSAQTPNDTATGTQATSISTYSFGTTVTTFKGAPAGTTFDAGGASDAFIGSGATNAVNVLNFDNLPSTVLGPLQVCVVAQSSLCSAGQALLGAVPDTFQNITTYEGLPSGNTTFFAGTPNNSTYEATPNSSQNVMNYSAAPVGVTVDFTVGSGSVAKVTSSGTANQDSIQNLTTVIGSNAGGNTLMAGSGNYTFTSNGNGNTFDGGPGTGTFTGSGNSNTFNVGTGADTLSDIGTGNTISFSAVSTGLSTVLTVNASGTPSGLIANDTATVGTVTYRFTNGGSGFTNFVGAATGNTDFLAPPAGGYSFSGSLTGNTADFSANNCAVTANLLTVPGTVALSSGTTCGTTTTDTISGVTTVIGSPGGSNVFEGALKGNIFTSASPTNTVSYGGFGASGLCFNLTGTATLPTGGTGDRVGAGTSCSTPSADFFNFSNSSPGSLTVEGTPASDTFQLGAPNVVLEGGGGSDTLDLSQIPAPPAPGVTGATVDLNGINGLGSVTLPGISGSGATTFTPGCGAAVPATDLCVTVVKGSKFNDSFTANAAALSTLPALNIAGGGGSDSLSLADIQTPATVNMPVTSGTPPLNTKTCSGATPGATGVVCPTNPQPGSKDITFTGLATVTGTGVGGDTFFAGSGAETLLENGAPGTLDYSQVPLPANNTTGITVEADDTSALGSGPGGSVSSSLNIGVSDTFTDMGTFNGTAYGDMFSQVGPGTYTFHGGLGSNTLNLSLAPAGVQVSLGPPDATCTANINNNDGTASGANVDDHFTCMATILSSTSGYTVLPGETATVNGNGTGTLVLDCLNNACATAGAATGMGVTVTMPATVGGTGLVTGDGFNFAFSGMQTVNGTPFNDLFTAGASSVSINGGGGNDGVSFAPETAGEVVNLSTSSYTVPAGLTDAGTTVPPDTAIGGAGGTITLNGISNVKGTASGNDIIVGGPGPGTLAGGSGNDTFLPAGGNDVITGGNGTNTLDLSLLPSYSTFNLGSAAPQQLGAGNGTLAVVPGTIQKVIASPSGSSLQAGPGNNITLMGGQGNDWLAAGTGTQTLLAGTGNDTLVAGVGNDTLKANSGPVTFVPGQGGTDTLISSSSPGNTLSYAGIPFGAQVNLSTQSFFVNGTLLSGGTAVGGWGATVQGLAGAQISQIIGSPEADTFYTGPTAINILGNGGNDLFQIYPLTTGTNNLTAGPGSASIFRFNGASSNIIDGGGNSTVDFSLAPAGVDVSLPPPPPKPPAPPPAGQATGGFGGAQSLQTLTGIQNVVGTNFADQLIAGAPGQTLTGMNGGSGDMLQTSPRGGDTLISGGTGPHTFCAEQDCNTLTSAPTGGSTMIGGSGTDDFFAQNGQVDHITGQAGDVADVDPQDVVTGTGITINKS